MTKSNHLTSAEVRRKVGHPIVDADGHQIELEPLLLDYLKEVAGPELADKAHKAFCDTFAWYGMSPEDRRARRAVRPPWGLQARNVEDIATTMLPGMLRSRMDRLGFDYSYIYPTMGIGFVRFAGEMRGAVARAINRYYADVFRPHADRLVPAAIIPMTSPAEALAEIEHAVVELGHKIIVIDCTVPRPVEALTGARAGVPREALRFMTWLDSFGVDSEHNYDPVWRRCVELGLSPTAHQAGMWGTRTSISSYVHNHLGMFGAAGEALCKSLFLGGVPFRFPKLQFAFLEGGAGWACSLFSDLIEHWERRNYEAVKEYYDPALLDRDKLAGLLREHGGERVSRLLDRPVEDAFRALFLLSGWTNEAGWQPHDKAVLDEFARCPIKSAEDIRDRFVENFYFGCEAEDPSVGWATGKGLPFDAPLRTMFGSDIGHWDVLDMDGVVAEAYEQVEHGVLTEAQFRDWVFVNPVRLHGKPRRDFFKGTAIEAEAAAVLDKEAQ